MIEQVAQALSEARRLRLGVRQQAALVIQAQHFKSDGGADRVRRAGLAMTPAHYRFSYIYYDILTYLNEGGSGCALSLLLMYTSHRGI